MLRDTNILGRHSFQTLKGNAAFHAVDIMKMEKINFSIAVKRKAGYGWGKILGFAIGGMRDRIFSSSPLSLCRLCSPQIHNLINVDMYALRYCFSIPPYTMKFSIADINVILAAMKCNSFRLSLAFRLAVIATCSIKIMRSRKQVFQNHRIAPSISHQVV